MSWLYVLWNVQFIWQIKVSFHGRHEIVWMTPNFWTVVYINAKKYRNVESYFLYFEFGRSLSRSLEFLTSFLFASSTARCEQVTLVNTPPKIGLTTPLGNWILLDKNKNSDVVRRVPSSPPLERNVGMKMQSNAWKIKKVKMVFFVFIPIKPRPLTVIIVAGFIHLSTNGLPRL